MKKLILAALPLLSLPAWAGIPATPVMTLYRFNGDLNIPYYDVNTFAKQGASSPAGTLSQGTSVIPCLVIRNGEPLTDRSGTPFVGFEILVDSRKATPESTAVFKKAFAERRAMTVPNHHCGQGVRHVLDVRNLYELDKAPFFDPPARQGSGKPTGRGTSQGQWDDIVRAFHNSPLCEGANRSLIGRREALERAWSRFVSENTNRWPQHALAQARHLDYTLRTAIYEGHLGRGCSAYGACERNIIALSIRNRARETCSRAQGCGFAGDFEGVASKVSQYNIWDEYLTQISGLTSCFLRDDLAGAGGSSADYYAKIRRMYEQSAPAIQRILFGDDGDLREIFPNEPLDDLKSVRHYYHAPAMGKCFPNEDRVEYMTGAVARKGSDFALIANTRIRADQQTEGGFFFREFKVTEDPDRDVTELVDNYPGFVVDGRKVDLRRSPSCPAYGIPGGCRFEQLGRYRKTPSWLSSGSPIEIACRVQDQGEKCQGAGKATTARVGGVCDKEMRPVARVP